jgi:hypothetical protein
MTVWMTLEFQPDLRSGMTAGDGPAAKWFGSIRAEFEVHHI